MPQITFLPSRQTVEAPPGANLGQVVRRAALPIAFDCGGGGTCGACAVKVSNGRLGAAEASVLSATARSAGWVLACRSTVGDDDLTVELPELAESDGGQFVDDGQMSPLRTPASAGLVPMTIKRLIAVDPPRMEDGLGDLDRLTRAIRKAADADRVECPLPVLRTLAEALRRQDGRVTVTLDAGGDEQPARIVSVEAGDTTSRHFAAAVDIGTTTVVARLIDLADGRVLATRSDYNDQIACGADVLSRINYASKPDRLEELRARVLGTINRLIDATAGAARIASAEVTSAVLSGNTTMQHLLLGLPPERIRLEPYTPTVLRFPALSAGEIGLSVAPAAPVLLSPCVGSYVGGDITAGLLCTDLADDSRTTNLFIDIGTNGELVVGNGEFLLACACSAGPAFEGGGIEAGCRAVRGAIERVEIDPASGTPQCWTIGGLMPRGICGSGMIDLLAGLFETGWLDQAGRLRRDRPCPAVEIDGRKARYVLVRPDQSATGKDIAVNEAEIASILRAKAAVYSACALMLRHVGMDFADLGAVFIAGGFGKHLDLDNARTIGLLPDLPADRFHYLGNTSLMGSHLLATSAAARAKQVELADRVTGVELSTEPNYMEQYTAALFLPHTDLDRFPSVRARMQQSSHNKSPGMAIPGHSTTNKERAQTDAAQLAARKLDGVDLRSRCALLGLPALTDGRISVRVFGQDLFLTPPAFDAFVGPSGEPRPAKPADRILALHYLLCDRPIKPTGELISFRDLPGGQFYWDSFIARSVKPLVGRIGNDLDLLRRHLGRFQWAAGQGGDLAARVQAVGLIDLTLIYRRGDDEFGPSADVLFDAAVKGVFDAEDAAVMAGRLCIGLL